MPANSQLVLSLFPGAGLLDRGFEQAGYCVVRGPDTLLGQSIENFSAWFGHGHFAGVIGGPPCQDFSRARRAPPTGHGVRMLGHFKRIVLEADPLWWLMENVPGVPGMMIEGYSVQRFNLFAWEFGLRQSRNRCFQFGSRDGKALTIKRTMSQRPNWLAASVLSHDRRSHGLPEQDGYREVGNRRFSRLCELQGLPRGFNLPGLSRTAKIRAVGNGVPVPMAKAVAEAIRDRGVTEGLKLCPCNCGRVLSGQQLSATAACRKRLQRARELAQAQSQCQETASELALRAPNADGLSYPKVDRFPLVNCPASA